MTTARSMPDERRILERCSTYTGDADQRPADQRWAELAADPNAALVDFQRNEDAFEYHTQGWNTEDGLPPKIRFAIAMGSLLVASEAGDPRARIHWRGVQNKVNSRIRGGNTPGSLAVQLMVNPVQDELLDAESGTALGVYLAASAMDQQAYTDWKKPVLTSLQESTQQGYEAARNVTRRLRGQDPLPRSSRPQDPSGKNFDMGHIDDLGRHSLRGYLGKYGLYPTTDEAILAATYGLVAQRMGAVAKYYANLGDRFSRQLTEDFLSSCMRLSGTSNPEKTTQRVYVELGALGRTMSEMFESAMLLFERRGVPVKGPGIPKTIGGVRSALKTTTVQAPNRPLAPVHTEMDRRLAPHSASRGIQPGVQVHPLGRRIKNQVREKIQARRQSTNKTAAGQQAAQANPAERRPSNSRESDPLLVRSFRDLLNAPSIDQELNNLPEDTVRAKNYPWSKVLVALTYRQHGDPARVSAREAKLFFHKRDTLHHLAWGQLSKMDALRMISNETDVRDDIFASAVEVHNWILRKVSGAEKLPGITPEEISHNRQLYGRAEQIFRGALESHMRKKYNLSPDFRMSKPMFNALAELTTFHLSGVWQDPNANKPAIQTFWKRLVGMFKGEPLNSAERIFFERATHTVTPRQNITVQDLPPKAQVLYQYLLSRTKTVLK